MNVLGIALGRERYFDKRCAIKVCWIKDGVYSIHTFASPYDSLKHFLPSITELLAFVAQSDASIIFTEKTPAYPMPQIMACLRMLAAAKDLRLIEIARVPMCSAARGMTSFNKLATKENLCKLANEEFGIKCDEVAVISVWLAIFAMMFCGSGGDNIKRKALIYYVRKAELRNLSAIEMLEKHGRAVGAQKKIDRLKKGDNKGKLKGV